VKREKEETLDGIFLLLEKKARNLESTSFSPWEKVARRAG
jgi:hypothetical protein